MTNNQGEFRMIDINQIQVPDLRVTSQFDLELLAELQESIARQGILQPIQCMEVEGKLWLVDGYHRILAAKNLGNTQVPAIVKPGTSREVVLQNLVVNRQRGKSNPAEEAKLIRKLREGEGLPLESIATLTGLSIGWTRKLHDISFLAPTVLVLVGEGRLGITHAMELLKLDDESLQIEVANQAVEWKYTVEQIRFRVIVLTQPQVISKPGEVWFDPRGEPSRVPIPCYVCHKDLTGNVTWLYMCGECQELINAFLREYFAHQETPETEESAKSPPKVIAPTARAEQGA